MNRKKHRYYPFDAGYSFTYPTAIFNAEDRVDRVKTFTREECIAALGNTYLRLQKTVRTAIERKIRKLEKQQS